MLDSQVKSLAAIIEAIHTPPQSLQKLSIGLNGNLDAVTSWLDELPILQTQLAAEHIQRLLNELLSLEISHFDKFSILTAVQKKLDAVFISLAKDYLNKPIILPDAARQAANTALSLQKQLTIGYWLCLKQQLVQIVSLPDALQQPATFHRLDQLIAAILSGVNQQLLKHLQLYIAIPKSYWQQAHMLFRVMRILSKHTDPSDLPSASLEYKKCMLLGAAQLNQLQQTDINGCFKYFDSLAAKVTLVPFDPSCRNNLFIIDAQSGGPPLHKAKFTFNSSRNNRMLLCEMNLNAVNEALVEDLRFFNASATKDASASALVRPPVSQAALTHLHQCLGQAPHRGFDRVSGNARIEITLGLSNLHFHLAEQTPFAVFLNRNEGFVKQPTSLFTSHRATPTSSISRLERDVWDAGISYDIDSAALQSRSTINIETAVKQQAKEDYAQSHPSYQTNLIDKSPGGYGLEWQHANDSLLKSGEIIGVKEAGDSSWTLGVIRWVRQVNDGVQFGVQVISPLAKPVALASITKTEKNSEYLRALLIPAIAAISQPATLITNALSFHETLKASLYEDANHISTIQFNQKMLATGAIAQFTFKKLEREATSQALELTPIK